MITKEQGRLAKRIENLRYFNPRIFDNEDFIDKPIYNFKSINKNKLPIEKSVYFQVRYSNKFIKKEVEVFQIGDYVYHAEIYDPNNKGVTFIFGERTHKDYIDFNKEPFNRLK